MVTRVNGFPQEGLWFSADAVFATLTVTGMTAAVDIATPTVNSSLEKVLEAVSTRGTVIGLRVTSDTVIQLLVDYGSAYTTGAAAVGGSSQTLAQLLDEVEAIIDADSGLSGAAFTNVGTDFTAG